MTSSNPSRSRSRPPLTDPSESITYTLQSAQAILESAQHTLLDNKYIASHVEQWDSMMADVNDVYIPPPSLRRILPHFHSIIALCVSSGMIQSILSVDIVFDYSVALMDDRKSKEEAFIYYFNILNSNFISLKTITAMITVLYGSYQAYIGTTKLDKFSHRGTGLRVTNHFKLIFILYSAMVVLYLSIIVPRYVQFMLRFHPAGIEFDEAMFNNWKVVFVTRLALTAINVTIIILALRLLPKLMINLYFRFRKQPSKKREEIEREMEGFLEHGGASKGSEEKKKEKKEKKEKKGAAVKRRGRSKSKSSK